MFEIFSLALIICLGIITPYIIKLANKDKDYKNKKFLFLILFLELEEWSICDVWHFKYL